MKENRFGQNLHWNHKSYIIWMFILLNYSICKYIFFDMQNNQWMVWNFGSILKLKKKRK